MKKKIWIVICCILLVVAIVGAYSLKKESTEETGQDKVRQIEAEKESEMNKNVSVTPRIAEKDIQVEEKDSKNIKQEINEKVESDEEKTKVEEKIPSVSGHSTKVPSGLSVKDYPSEESSSDFSEFTGAGVGEATGTEISDSVESSGEIDDRKQEDEWGSMK